MLTTALQTRDNRDNLCSKLQEHGDPFGGSELGDWIIHLSDNDKDLRAQAVLGLMPLTDSNTLSRLLQDQPKEFFVALTAAIGERIEKGRLPTKNDSPQPWFFDSTHPNSFTYLSRYILQLPDDEAKVALMLKGYLKLADWYGVQNTFSEDLERLWLVFPAPVQRGLLTAKSAAVRRYAISRSAEFLNAKLIRESLRQELQDTDEACRALAVEKLADCHDLADAEAFIAASKDPSQTVRISALHAMKTVAARAFVPRLLELLDDTDPKIRAIVHEALNEIRGREREREDWQKWYEGKGAGPQPAPAASKTNTP